jgi:hypothetical protein
MNIKKLISFDYQKIKNLIKIILAATITYFFLLYLIGKIDLQSFILIIILFIINYSLFYIYFLSKKELNYIPIYPLIIFYYLLTYTSYFYFNYELAPIYGQNFSTDQFVGKYIYPEMNILTLIISLGLIFFSFGYFFLNFLIFKKNIYWLKLELNNKIELFLIAVLILFVIFYYINLNIKILDASIIPQLKFPIEIFLLAYFQVKYLLSKNIFIFLIMILLLFSLFIIEVSMGSTVFPYLLLITPIFVSFYITKQVNFLTVMLLCLSAFIVHTFKYEVREATWIYPEENKPIKEEPNKMLNNLNSAIKVYSNPSYDTFFSKGSIAGQKNRLYHSNISLQIVLTKTPHYVDLYDGKSYNSLISKFVPRFLYQNKKKEEWGNFWGKRYKVLNKKDVITSWNFPVLNEFYANFGVKGVIFGMFFLGFLIKTLLIFLCSNTNQPILFSIASTIMLNFFFLESNLSMVLGAVINQLLFFSVIIISILFLNFLIKKISN